MKSYKNCELRINLKDKTIALWGLAFKPNTDDVRAAPSRDLMELLWSKGAKIQAYDPMAMKNIGAIYSDQPQLTLCGSAEQALQNADVLAIITEWPEFRSFDIEVIKNELHYPAIFDGRNIFEPRIIQQHGVKYFGIGRGLSLQEQKITDNILETI